MPTMYACAEFWVNLMVRACSHEPAFINPYVSMTDPMTFESGPGQATACITSTNRKAMNGNYSLSKLKHLSISGSHFTDWTILGIGL